MVNLEQQVSILERTIFGHKDSETYRHVPGILDQMQTMLASEARRAGIDSWVLRGLALLIVARLFGIQSIGPIVKFFFH